MEAGAYEIEAEIEATHWWFAGRRRLFAAEIKRMGLDRRASVLDIGTSTGTNLRMLREMGFSGVVGLDSSEDAVRFCSEKGLTDVKLGDACDLPFPDDSLDLILATDIIEHVEDDARAIAEIARVLARGGKVLITVPAFSALWGVQDEVGMHKRRYRKHQVVRLAQGAGLIVRCHYYFNYLLFVPIWLVRLVVRRARVSIRNENNINSILLNHIFRILFAVDVATARWISPPFGVSALVIAEKTL